MADTELSALRKECITSLYLCTDNVAKYLDTEKEAEFSKLKSYVEEYSLLEAQQKVAIEALEKAKSKTDTENMDMLEQKFWDQLNKLTPKAQAVHNNNYVSEFNKRVARAKAQLRQNMNDSDLTITESQDQFIDPITKKPIEDPVKNIVCAHVYEKASILKLISLKSRTRCPVAGCGNRGPITKEDLISDDELRFRAGLNKHSTMLQGQEEERSVMDLDAMD